MPGTGKGGLGVPGAGGGAYPFGGSRADTALHGRRAEHARRCGWRFATVCGGSRLTGSVGGGVDKAANRFYPFQKASGRNGGYRGLEFWVTIGKDGHHPIGRRADVQVCKSTKR